MQLYDIIEHKLRINTHWEDYYRFEFYRRDKSWEERSMYLGERGSRYWPWEGNSLKFDPIFVRKSLQKAIAIAHGLPTPTLLMRVGKFYPIHTKSAFKDEMAKVDVPFILKVDGGMQGSAVHLFEPENGEYRHNDELVTADWIWERFEKSLNPGFLIEEQVSNHPVLDAVYPLSLNTLRLVTVRTRDGELHLLRPLVKFGRSGARVDNIKAGGMLALIDEDHRLGPAFNVAGDRFETHPDTGAEIEGLEVPLCAEAYELAFHASRSFGFVSTIGWDIAVTPDGPMIIEGNARWGSDVVQDFVAPYLTPEIAAGMMPRSWWTPWDRTHLYPGHIAKMSGGWWQKMLAKRRNRWLG